jgi:hypothetical protein
MQATIYQATDYVTHSVIHAIEIASIEIDNEMDVEQLVSEHDGDLIEITPGEEEHE